MWNGDMIMKFVLLLIHYMQAIDAVADKEWVWVVDPLDGTTNYVSVSRSLHKQVYNLPLSVVSICITHTEVPVIGVTYHPYLDEMYTVIKGHGSKLNGTPIHVRNDATLHESVVGYATNYMAPIRRVMMRGVAAVGEYALSTRSVGSAALHLAWVAAGRLTGYWELALHPVCLGIRVH